MKFHTIASATLLVASLAACNQSNASAKDDQSTAKRAKAAPGATVPAAAATPSGAAGTSLAGADGTYGVDSAHSQVMFAIEHLGVSRQYGMFTRVEGSFSINAANLAASEIDITIPTASVFTAVKKRDDHLRSPDFFDAKQFPQATFKSKQIKATGANTYAATGDLTLRGVTKTVTLALEHGGSKADPEMMGGKFRSGFNGTVTIKRGEFGINYMQGGGLGDEVTLMISLEGTRN